MNEDELSDADLWEKKRRDGFPPEVATKYVQARQQRLRAQQADTPLRRATGLARTLAQGATFGLADEVEGGWRGIAAMVPGGKSPAQAVEEGIANAREDVERFRGNHPGLAFGAELAGGVAGGVGGGAALGKTALGKAAGALPSVTRLVGGGAIAGGVAGAGAAEGGVRDRLIGAGKGATIGAATAGGFGLAAGGANAARGTARNLMDVAGLSPKATPANPIVRAIVPKSHDARADEVLARSLGRSSVAQDGNPEQMLADFVPRVARAVGSIPSRGSEEVGEALTRRQQGQVARLSDKLQTRTGLTRDNVPQLQKEIIQRRKEAAAPLYAKAYESGDVMDDDILELLQKPSVKKAYERAKAIAEEEGVPLRDLDNEFPDIRTLDYIKRGIDDMLASEKGPGGLGPIHQRAIRETKNKLLARADEISPDFKAARSIYSGESEALEGLELGQKFFNMTPDEAREAMSELSESGRDMARRGAIDKALLKLDAVGDTNDATKKLGGSRLARQQLRLLFDSDEAMEAMIADIQQEAQMGRTFNTFRGGSNTVDKAQDLAETMGIDLGELANNPSPTGLITRGVAKGLTNRMRGVNTQIADALAPKLTAKGDDLGRILAEVLEIQKRQAAAQAARAAGTRGAAATSGLWTGGQ